MATYLIGDIHGCYDELQLLLEQVNFSAKNDCLWLTGDIVARGKDSLKVLRYLHQIRNSVRMVLGNHDIHLLAIHANTGKLKPSDQLEELLGDKECDELLDWLRHQPLLQIDTERKLLMAHAGLYPKWDLTTAIECANEVSDYLKSSHYHTLLKSMYGNTPKRWSPKLTGAKRYRFILNAFTRMRFCNAQGDLDLSYKGVISETPDDLYPWFSIATQYSKEYHIAFGHWASLEQGATPDNISALDTGCCWGNELTLLHWETKHYHSVKALPKPKTFTR